MGRRRALLALFGAAGLVAAASVVALGDDDAATVDVAAGTSSASEDASSGSTTTTSEVPSTSTSSPAVTEPPTTTSTAASPTTARPRPPTTTSTTSAPVRHAAATAPSGSWSLVVVDDGGHHCVELVATAGPTARVLCDVAPVTAGDLVGDVASFAFGDGWAVVAVVGTDVRGLGTGLPGDPNTVAAGDPTRATHRYAAVTFHRATQAPRGVLVFDEPHVLGRFRLPAEARSVPRAELDLTTSLPYGRWPGYRFGGHAGLWWGGFQHLGFYDGPDGTTCVLFRRLVNEERVLADSCPARAAAGNAIAHGSLVLDHAGGTAGHQPFLVFDGPVTSWDCGPEVNCQYTSRVLVADPAGTGRSAGAFRAQSGAPRSVLAFDGDREVGRVTMTAP